MIEHLAELGLQPDDIDPLVCTHFDVDHAGYHDAFTKAELIVQRLFTPDRPTTPGDDNAEQLRASTRKLLDVVEREHVALVVFGHDGTQWRTLKKAPDYYD